MLRASVAMSVVFFSSVSLARQPDGAALQRAVDRLGVVGRVLYVAAHPDDENTRLLAWLANDKSLRAGYLSLTRGEGGQNLIGAEQSPLLGVIRTQELLAARAVDGAEQWFGLERDFGYSKNPEETLAIWDHDAALGDVVWAIRRFRPDVILTRFAPDMRDTHGHHTASAMLALEAFSAAADPKAYPEQLKLVEPWQARRIAWNKGVWPGMAPGDLTGFVQLDVGGYDPILGASYGELAARSRSMHKSQGFGATPQRGPAMEYFKLLAGEPMQHSFLDGIDISWHRVKGAEKLISILDKVRAGFKTAHPAESIPALLEALDALDSLPDNAFKKEKRAELVNVIAGCAGLYADAVADEFVAVPGGERKIAVSVINRSTVPLKLREIKLPGETVVVGTPLGPNQPFELQHALKIPADTAPSNPYWLNSPPSAGRWTVSDQMLVGLPESPPPISVEFVVESGNRHFSISRAVDFAWTDPVAGERRRPLEILPAVTVGVSAPLMVFTDAKPKELRVTVSASGGPSSGVLKPSVPEGWSLAPSFAPFALAKKGDETALLFHVRPPSAEGDRAATLHFAIGDINDSTGVLHIEYPHIPIQTLSPVAQVKLLRLGLKRAVTHIGYIPGAGDETPAALRQAGYDMTLLSDEALTHDALGHFEAIVIGARAFNVNAHLFTLHKRLMDYVSAGGTLLAQYNTQNRMTRIAGDIGPYPFNISQDRVTEENAAVTMDQNPILRAPNHIESTDFNGWIQERGLYFADKWDDHYQTPLTMHDSGESPKKGALLVTHFGKGTFIYTGLAFFRQLPAGVPGAFRLFANLLSLGAGPVSHGR